MNFSKHAAYFMALTKLHSLECYTHNRVRSLWKTLGGSLTFPERIRDLTCLGRLTVRCLTLDLPQRRVLRRIRSVATCLQPHQKMLGKGAQKSRPQKPPSSHSGPPLSSRWAEACPLNTLDLLCHLERQERVPDFTIPSSLPALKSGVRVSFSWKTTEGLFSLTKQRRKHLQKTLSWKELQFCLLKTSRAQDISDSSVCICLEVQGVSKVFLNTNRILGQHPVRRDGSQTQIVGNRLKKTNKKNTTDVNIETDIV